jgi:AcrR family transcriptional regulator
VSDAAEAVVMTTAEGRQLTAKGSATRNRIIETATDLFASEGYAGVTIREVAARSGVTTGAIYATFRGKAELLVEAVRASIAIDLDDIPESLRARPLPLIDAHQFTAGDQPRRERLRTLLLEAAVAARTDAGVREHLHRLLTDRLDEWTDSHQLWQTEAGVDAELDMRSLTALLMCVELGAGVMAAVGIGEPSSAQTAMLVERMLQGLVPPRRRRRSSAGTS